MYIYKILSKLDSIEGKLDQRLRKGWLSLKDVMKYTTLSESTIRREVSKGVLKTSKKTGKLLFKIDDVERWLNG